jgi:SWI/SNF-related matrix-associated actin-dependent regulator 1 of chromatin subfamily A
VELWPIANALAPASFSNFFTFAKRYCAATKTRYGWDFSGASHLEELQRELRVTCMVRRTKEEVLKEIPSKRRQIVVLPPNGASSVVAEEVRVYREAQERQESIRQRILQAQDAGDRDTYKEEVAALTRARRESFAEISRVRHRVALAKVPSAASFIEDLLESEQKVVVWAHHLDVIQSLADALRAYNPVTLTGETPAAEKQRAVDRFQSDPSVRVFLGGITAAGVGITLTAASTEVFVELDWVPGRMAQAEDRCHRIGQASAVLVLHLVLDGSLDQILAETLIEKQEISEQALDRTLLLEEDVG